MSEPLDEDAPLVAGVAVNAVDLLNDATARSVGYPGLASVHDLVAVLGSLSRLAEELQDTAGHLDDYLVDQRDQDRLRSAPSASVPADVAADALRAALAEVRRRAGDLSSAIAAAELAADDIVPG